MASKKYGKSRRSNAGNWFLHRITGTFLVFLLITHFWVQHYDHTTRSVVEQVVQKSEGDKVEYADAAKKAVQEKFGTSASVTSYDVLMLRLADPVYAVLWKAFNILFMMAALHHGFYGLNNVMTDYIRNPLSRKIATSLSWTLALILFVIGLYSVVVAGWGYSPVG
jgi:succinate dehydrogenase / fumarate reductase membrane anchor subunit